MPAIKSRWSVWLNLHNENQLSQLLTQQTTKGSGQFHKWLSQSQVNATYSPTSQEVNAVQNFLSAHNLSVIYVAENNFYVKVQGSISDIQKLFTFKFTITTSTAQSIARTTLIRRSPTRSAPMSPPSPGWTISDMSRRSVSANSWMARRPSAFRYRSCRTDLCSKAIVLG